MQLPESPDFTHLNLRWWKVGFKTLPFFYYLCGNAKVPNTIGSPFWRYRLLGTLIFSASFHLVARTQVRLVYCANPSIYLVLYIQSIPRFMYCMDWGIKLPFRSFIIEVTRAQWHQTYGDDRTTPGGYADSNAGSPHRAFTFEIEGALVGGYLNGREFSSKNPS